VVVAGIIHIVTAMRLRKGIDREWLLAFASATPSRSG
jgi:hypothetical protein